MQYLAFQRCCTTCIVLVVTVKLNHHLEWFSLYDLDCGHILYFTFEWATAQPEATLLGPMRKG